MKFLALIFTSMVCLGSGIKLDGPIAGQDQSLKRILSKVTSRDKKLSFQEFKSLLTKKDGYPHILSEDVNRIMAQLQSEFPDLLKISSIGSTAMGKEIKLITLDFNKNQTSLAQQTDTHPLLNQMNQS